MGAVKELVHPVQHSCSHGMWLHIAEADALYCRACNLVLSGDALLSLNLGRPGTMRLVDLLTRRTFDGRVAQPETPETRRHGLDDWLPVSADDAYEVSFYGVNREGSAERRLDPDARVEYLLTRTEAAVIDALRRAPA